MNSVLNYSQQYVFNDTSDVVVLNTCRQWGKSLIIKKKIQKCINNNEDFMVLTAGYNMLELLMLNVPTKYRNNFKVLEKFTFPTIIEKENVFIDEAALLDNDIGYALLNLLFDDKRAPKHTFIASSPYNKWFKTLFVQGLIKDNWMSYSFSSVNSDEKLIHDLPIH